MRERSSGTARARARWPRAAALRSFPRLTARPLRGPRNRPRPARRRRPLRNETALRGASVNPSRIFIDRPVATSLLMIAILLVGIVAFRFLPLSALPEVDYPTIQVQTFYPGASPEVMTSAVTAPLERQFGQMASLSQM